MPTVRRRSDTERPRCVLPLHTRSIMGGDGVSKVNENTLHESMPDKNWDSIDDDECAICADDYHDSDQYICDDCKSELDSLQADQEASRWD